MGSIDRIAPMVNHGPGEPTRSINSSNPNEDCNNCGVKGRVIYSAIVGKKFCTNCGHPLSTKEQELVLSGTKKSEVAGDNSIIDEAKVIPNTSNEIKIDQVSSTAATGSNSSGGYYRSEGMERLPGGSEGGITMAFGSGSNNKRKAGIDLNSQLSDDPDTRRLQNQGYTILSSEERVLTGPNVWETVSSDELRRRTQEDRAYDKRYEGQPDGDPLDRSIHSSSGLSMQSTRNNRSNDDDDNTSNGLKV